MMEFTKWEDFCKSPNKGLLHTELEFTEIQKGTLIYVGEYYGKRVVCNIHESSMNDLEYGKKETVKSLTNADMAHLTIDDNVIFNSY